MNRMVAHLCIVTLCLGVGFSSGQEERLNIAVNNLLGKSVPQSDADIISDRLRAELINTRAFRVMERGEMEAILKEQGFGQTGCTSDECVVEVGQLLGVKRMVAGNVGKVGGLYTITARMINIETGEILFTANVDCKCPVDNVLTHSTKKLALQLARRTFPDHSFAHYTISPLPVEPVTPVEKPNLRRRNVRRKVLPRVVLGVLSAGCGVGGLLLDRRIQTENDELSRIENIYRLNPTSAAYDRYSSDYQTTWDSAHTMLIVRNILYGCAGAGGIGFTLSIVIR